MLVGCIFYYIIFARTGKIIEFDSKGKTVVADVEDVEYQDLIFMVRTPNNKEIYFPSDISNFILIQKGYLIFQIPFFLL